MLKIKDEDLQELVSKVLITLSKVGNYKVKVADRFLLVKDAERVIKKAVENYMLASVHHLMEKQLRRNIPKVWIPSEAMRFVMELPGEKQKQEEVEERKNDQRKNEWRKK